MFFLTTVILSNQILMLQSINYKQKLQLQNFNFCQNIIFIHINVYKNTLHVLCFLTYVQWMQMFELLNLL